MKLSTHAFLLTFLAAFAALATSSLAASALPASEGELNCVLAKLCETPSVFDGSSPFPMCGAVPCQAQSPRDGASPIPWCGPTPCPPSALDRRSQSISAAETGLEVGKQL